MYHNVYKIWSPPCHHVTWRTLNARTHARSRSPHTTASAAPVWA